MQKLPRFEDLRRDEASKMLDYFLRMVVALTPVSVLVTLGFVVEERVGWRSAVFAAMVVSLTAASVALLRQQKRGGAPATLPGVMAVTAGVQLVGVVVTGGIDSPFTPETVITAVLLALFLPPAWARVCVGIQIAIFVALTVAQSTGVLHDALPRMFGGGPRAGAASLAWVRGLSFVVFLYSALEIGRRVQGGFEAAGRRAVEARDDALASYAEEARTLTLLAGEIAHELKNPLATVKGLSSLVAQEVREGKNAERISMVRREAERMHGILDEFLNFSRPLVPLAEERVAIPALLREVARLHEGLASERGVLLRVHAADGVEARGDRRKLKQVVINLVQNAIAASPANAEVALVGDVGEHDGGGVVRVSVVDHGPGVAKDVAGRVFDPGITTKPGGSGFGLTISRALARQHGGELTLESTSTGCTARLVLPAAEAPR